MPIIRAAAPSAPQAAQLPAEPRIAVIAGEAGYRAILATFIRSEWPCAAIEEVDPFSQTMLGMGVNLRGRCDAIVVAGLGTLNEASSALARLSAGAEATGLPPVILLVGPELAMQSAQLLALGAAAVFLRDALSRATLINAIAAFAPGATQRKPAPVRVSSDPARFGRFACVQEGESTTVAIEGYRALRALANNAFASLYLAEPVDGGANVVVKIGTATPYHDNRLAQQFCARYGFLFAQTDGSVVRYVDAGIAGSWPYVVIEYLGEDDLRRRLAAPLPPREALGILQRVCKALATLHRGQVAHLDLKPENIFFRADGSVVLIDFNISTPFGKTPRDQLQKELMGSPYYMSPEQSSRLPVDGRSDLYSLGVVLFEALTGVRPFTGDNSVQVIYKHLHEEIPLLPRALRHLQPLVDNLLAKLPDERIGSVDALHDQLQHYLDEAPAAGANGAT